MALATRFNNLRYYLSPKKLKAVFGLLTSEQRIKWIQTVAIQDIEQIPVANALPWYNFDAIDFLERQQLSRLRVLEMGGGYSTLWWSKRCLSVTTIERQGDWKLKLSRSIAKNSITNVDLIDNVPGVVDKEEYCKQYLSCLADGKKYDVIIIDDVCRSEALLIAVNKVQKPGILILDDSERLSYQSAMDKIDGYQWARYSFSGTAPFHFHEKQTTIWLLQ